MKLAHTIKIRHACDCDTALQPPAEDGTTEHTFEIDGQPFPWYISEAGPAVRQIGALYEVTVSIICEHIDAAAGHQGA
jgi:hypothetical protein